VPPGPVTLSVPLAPPAGAIATICVSDVTANDAAVPLKVTAVAPVKPEPLIVTVVPAVPLSGENELIEGGAVEGVWVALVTEKLVELFAVPAGVVTLIGPLDAPLGIVAVI
jgi:hypothetical protein